MLHLDEVTLRIGGHVLLDRVSLRVPAGHKVGLVGRNGSGKTSLLRLIKGDLAPDAGEVRLRAGTRVDWVAQEAPGGEETPRDAVLAADTERAQLMREAETADDPYRIGEVQSRLAEIGAHAAPAKASAILNGLGFDEAAQAQPLSAFSGGWRMRVALAAVLFAEPDLLLLDEPTNHLDLEASLWLEDYLRRYPRTLIMVSHDRDLLNSVPERIVHLEEEKLYTYVGAYDAFERARREKLALLAKERDKQEAKRRHMQAFVDRFRYKASKARQAQSRLKAMEKMAPIPEITEAPNVVLRFPKPDIPAPPLITLEDVSAGYGEHVVLDRLDLRIDPDDRIALLGKNGNGKSTFAKLIAGRLDPLDGTITRPPRLRVGYFAQHQIEDLVPNDTALSHMARALPDAREEALRARLGAFGLGRDIADRRARQLSGGEKARLVFALICALDPQILILDEPTNHLDIDSREALIGALNDFPGAVIVISHDRHLIELVADRLWLVANRRVWPFEGDLDDYRRLLLESTGESKAETAGEGGAKQHQRRRRAEKRVHLAPLRQAAKAAEREIEQLNADHAEVAARLADAATYERPGEEVEALLRRDAELKARIEAAEARWLEAQDAIEQTEAGGA